MENSESEDSVLIKCGNAALTNIGVKEEIRDVAVLYSDEFWVRWFASAFSNIDFSKMELAKTTEDKVNNIAILINFLE
jgi:hypothetical protein